MTQWPEGRARHGGIDELPLPEGPGRLWLCGKHAVGPSHEGLMAEVGLDVIVCLCESPEIAERYPSYVHWLEAEAGPEGSAIWFPIPDLHAPSADLALPFLDELRDHLRLGRRVLMHCGAGFGRTGTMAAALLMRMGMSRNDAVAAVSQARPSAGPEVGAQSDLLIDLASELQRPTRNCGSE